MHLRVFAKWIETQKKYTYLEERLKERERERDRKKITFASLIVIGVAIFYLARDHNRKHLQFCDCRHSQSNATLHRALIKILEI